MGLVSIRSLGTNPLQTLRDSCIGIPRMNLQLNKGLKSVQLSLVNSSLGQGAWVEAHP